MVSRHAVPHLAYSMFALVTESHHWCLSIAQFRQHDSKHICVAMEMRAYIVMGMRAHIAMEMKAFMLYGQLVSSWQPQMTLPW